MERNIRINKVLRELNISLVRAVEFLKFKGINIVSSLNSKINNIEYEFLLNQFKDSEIPKIVLEIENDFDILLFEKKDVGFIENFGRNNYLSNDKNEVIELSIYDVKISNLNFLTKIKNIEKLSLIKCELNEIKQISFLKNLKVLELQTNNIGKYNAVKELDNLLVLTIADNTIEDFNFLPTNLKFLSMCDCNLSDISFLEQTPILEKLDLSYNNIEDISILKRLRQIKSLDLSHNKIKNIDVLSDFQEFLDLNLESNLIEDISALRNIKFEEELFIGQNRIMDLTPLYFELKRGKFFLNHFDNPIIYPPKEFERFSENIKLEWFDTIIENCNEKINKIKENGDTFLDLGMMGLTDLSLIPKLFELENLEELILSNHYAKYDENGAYWERENSKNIIYPNNIYKIPDEIKNLKNLKKLIAGGDWKKNGQWNRWRIKDVSFINKLDNIEFINLSNNKIVNFKITRELKRLKTIHINNNSIISISVSRARNLEYLFASNNQIENLNFLVKSSNLRALDLHTNKVKDLSPIKALIEKIGILNDQWEYHTISIAKNNLENPGIEVVDKGKDAVLKMMKINYGVKTFNNNEIKLILVGNSEVGKTTLSKYLAKASNYKDKHPFTLWLEILEVYNENNIVVNIFDFGGHEYFHDTHHIFFTKNCLYFLLWDKSNDHYKIRDLNQTDTNGNSTKLQTIDYPISYWLDSINHFIKERITDNFSDEMKENFENIKNYTSSALIIQNKVNRKEDIKYLNQNDIIVKYPFIFDFINLDFHNEKNLSLLNQRFEEMISNLGKVSGGKYPIYYKKIKENIKHFKGYQNKKIISFNEFKKFCQVFKRELTTDDDFLAIANFLKNIGLILISNDEKTFYLDLNFISKQIIKIYDGLQNSKGILKEIEIKAKNIEEYESIMKLILDFNMAFEITKKEEKNYIFPLYLPKEPSKLVELLLRDNLKIYKRIQYDGFMHKSIILHIFSEHSNKIITEEIDKNTYYWKNGLIVKENNDLVLIKFFEGNETENAYIDLYNFGSDEIFVEGIKEKIILLNKQNNYDVKEYVSNDGYNFIPLELIHQNEVNKNEVFLNENDSKYYKLFDFKKYLKNKNNMMKKVFISYSRQNLQYKDNLKTHLSILERYGLLKAWSCEEIDAGKWNQQIQKELEESDIIIYMVSADFMSSDYIMNDEVKKGIELVKKNPDKKIICVLVGVCQWKNWSVFEEIYNLSKDESGKFSMNLSQFQFLPYHQYKNETGISIREEIVALEKWGRHPYDVVNEAYNQIVSKILDEVKN